mgnify:CR=1 FL=1
MPHSLSLSLLFGEAVIFFVLMIGRVSSGISSRARIRIVDTSNNGYLRELESRDRDPLHGDKELITFLRRIDVTEWVDAVSGWMPLRSPPVLCLVLMFVEHHVPTLLTLRLVSRTFQVAVDRLPHWHGLLPSCRQLQRKATTLRHIDSMSAPTPPSERGWATPSEDRGVSPLSECMRAVANGAGTPPPPRMDSSPVDESAEDVLMTANACALHACHHKPDGPKAASGLVRQTFKRLTDNEKSMHHRSRHRGLGSLAVGFALLAATVVYAVWLGLFVTKTSDSFLAAFLVFAVAPFVVTSIFRTCCMSARHKTACLRLLPFVATLLPPILFGTLTTLLTGHHEGSRLLAYDNAELDVCGIVSPEMAHPALIDTILSRLASSTADSPPFLVVNASALSLLPDGSSRETCPAVQRAIADALWGTEVNDTDSTGVNATAQRRSSSSLAATVAFVASEATGNSAVVASMKALLPFPRDVELRRGWPTRLAANGSRLPTMWTEAESLRWSVAAMQEPSRGVPPYAWVTLAGACTSESPEDPALATPLESESDLSEDAHRLSRRTAATYHVVRMQALDDPCFCRVVHRVSRADVNATISPSADAPRFLLGPVHQCVPLGLVNDSAGRLASSSLGATGQLPLDTYTTPCNVSLWPCLRTTAAFVAEFGLVCCSWQANATTRFAPPSADVSDAPFVAPKPDVNRVVNATVEHFDDADFWRSVGILIELESSEVSRRASAIHPDNGKTVRSVRFPKGTLFELWCPATVLQGSTCDIKRQRTIASCSLPLLRYTALIPATSCATAAGESSSAAAVSGGGGGDAASSPSSFYYAVPVIVASAAVPFWARNATAFSSSVIAPLESFRRLGTQAPRTLDADWTATYAKWLAGAPRSRLSPPVVERQDCASNLGPGLTMGKVVSDDGLLLQTAFRIPVFGSVREPATLDAIAGHHALDTSGEGFVLVAESLHQEGPYPMVSSLSMRYLRESVYAPALSVTLVCWGLVSLPSIVVFPLLRTRAVADRLQRFWISFFFGPLNGAVGIGIGAYCIAFSGPTDASATHQPLVCLSTSSSMVLVVIAASLSLLLQIALLCASC